MIELILALFIRIVFPDIGLLLLLLLMIVYIMKKDDKVVLVFLVITSGVAQSLLDGIYPMLIVYFASFLAAIVSIRHKKIPAKKNQFYYFPPLLLMGVLLGLAGRLFFRVEIPLMFSPFIILFSFVEELIFRISMRSTAIASAVLFSLSLYAGHNLFIYAFLLAAGYLLSFVFTGTKNLYVSTAINFIIFFTVSL